MEKRAFLAILLSIAVLTVYSTIVSKSKPFVKQEVTSTIAVYNHLAGQPQQATPQNAKLTPPPPQEVQKIPAEHYSVSTNKFDLIFSKIGGSLAEIYLRDYDVSLIGGQFLAVEEFNNLPFSFEKQLNKAILTYKDKDLIVEKIFSFSPDSYLIEWSLIISNPTNQVKNQNLHIVNSSLDFLELESKPDFRHNIQFIEHSISLPDKILRTNVQTVKSKKAIAVSTHFNWTGIRDRYFCNILKPQAEVQGYFIQPIHTQSIITGILSNPTVRASSSYYINGVFYAGPQDINILKSFNLGLEEIVDFGLFNPISQIIIKVLKSMQKVVPSWGLSIIGLSILISVLFYPLTWKSLNSMKKMQLLQPEMEQLKQTYKDQPQKLNREVLEFYRKHKVNPFSGCLPMFLQMPIFFALYQALMRSIELRGARFLWIKDLSQPDRLFILPRAFPVIGNEINILPLLMLIFMVFQQGISVKGNPSTSSEQQKFMMLFFPVIFGFIFYHFPSGLTLYWTCYSIISLLSQGKLLFIKKG